MASLWSVEDASTAYLMTRFYEYLREGLGKGEAMRQAQLDTMQEYPSPYYWAAFTLIGDMGVLGTRDHAVQVETVETPEESDTPDVPSRHWLWIGGAVLLLTVGGAWVWRHKLHIITELHLKSLTMSLRATLRKDFHNRANLPAP